MTLVLVVLFAVYAIPLGSLLVASLATFDHGPFYNDSAFVYFASRLSDSFIANARELTGVVLIPLVTAYSIELRRPGQRLPITTKRIFVFLAFLLVVSLLLYGGVRAFEPRLRVFSAEVFENLEALTASYVREALAYIALIFGFTLKGREDSAE